jgi:DNA-binding MarR family transcriptional regulator
MPQTLTKLKKAVDTFRILDEGMPLNVIITFLALADGEEQEVRDLQKQLNIPYSNLNRALTTLGERHWSKKSTKHGLELVDQVVHPEDRRVRIAKLSPKGKLLVKQLEELE